MDTTTTDPDTGRTEHPWWDGDPNVAPCPTCECPIQGGPMGMSRHKATVHPAPRSPHRPKATS